MLSLLSLHHVRHNVNKWMGQSTKVTNGTYQNTCTHFFFPQHNAPLPVRVDKCLGEEWHSLTSVNLFMAQVYFPTSIYVRFSGNPAHLATAASVPWLMDLSKTTLLSGHTEIMQKHPRLQGSFTAVSQCHSRVGLQGCWYVSVIIDTNAKIKVSSQKIR